MPLTGGDINKIPPGPGGSARLRAGACRHLHDHRRGTTARPGRARNAKVPGRFPARGLPVPASVPWSRQATGYTVRPQARRLPTAGRAVRQPAGRSPAAVTRTDPP